MASLHQDTAPGPALAQQAAIPAHPASIERRMADAVRALAIDAAAAARTGHSGMTMGMADAATVLWTQYLKFDAADPHWPDRDRFLLSAGNGTVLLHALLHLTGHNRSGIETLQSLRQSQSPADELADYGPHPAIAASMGPPGHGLAVAAGMALAERLLAARFGKSLVDHRTWVIASDADLMAGISHETASLAGHLKLHKLAVLYDDSGIPSDAESPSSCSDDVLKRFAAYGWTVRWVERHDAAQIEAALSFALRSRKPTLIACRNATGPAVPLSGAVATPGAPVGEAEAAAMKRAWGWHRAPFAVPEIVAARWWIAGARGAAARRGWLKRVARHPMRAEFERVIAGRLSDTWHEAMAAMKASLAEHRPSFATQQSSRQALAALVPALPELIGGSADPTTTELTSIKGMGTVAPGNYRGRHVCYGIREHGMAAAMNGMALHGGIIPYAGTFLGFSDTMRPALRQAALAGTRVIHLLAYDSTGSGDDGAAHQPAGHLASLRALPNLYVFRPADAMETAECWELALRRAEGPSLLVLTRQPVPALRTDAAENRCARGGYVLAEADGARQATLIASGSEVATALAAREALAREGVAAAVVSLPCWELFGQQDAVYRAGVLGGVPRMGIEAALGFGWERWLGDDGWFAGANGSDSAAPVQNFNGHGGITAEAVVAALKKRLNRGHA